METLGVLKTRASGFFEKIATGPLAEPLDDVGSFLKGLTKKSQTLVEQAMVRYPRLGPAPYPLSWTPSPSRALSGRVQHVLRPWLVEEALHLTRTLTFPTLSLALISGRLIRSRDYAPSLPSLPLRSAVVPSSSAVRSAVRSGSTPEAGANPEVAPLAEVRAPTLRLPVQRHLRPHPEGTRSRPAGRCL